ncbi:MAG: hypothetical protein GX592_13665 [Clostridiales bacterium]|nr:hypothetical protein [Clostridiales bacterium]
MKTIRTVCGEMRAEEAGLICVHEHLILDMTHEAVVPKTEAERALFHGGIRMENLGVLRRNPYVVQTNLELDSVEDAVDELRPLLDRGCNLLLDLTSVGLGRDARKLREISERTGLHIACGCGLFVHDSRVEPYSDWGVDEIARWMLREIRDGIEDTGICPGVIGEIGTSEVIHPFERRALLAAAIASAETGLPVYVHTYPWSRAGLEAVDLLLVRGVPAKRICICHLDVTFDEETILRALDRGVYVEFDNLGKEFYFEAADGAFAGGPFETDVSRARMLKKLIEGGYAEQLLLANDLCLKASLRKYGGWGYDHLFTNFVPMMRMEGIPAREIERLIRLNPRTFLFGD